MIALLKILLFARAFFIASTTMSVVIEAATEVDADGSAIEATDAIDAYEAEPGDIVIALRDADL